MVVWMVLSAEGVVLILSRIVVVVAVASTTLSGGECAVFGLN